MSRRIHHSVKSITPIHDMMIPDPLLSNHKHQCMSVEINDSHA